MRQGDNHSYQIGEVAKASNMSVYTIRYYEKLGLLGRPSRSNGGFRLYSAETIEKLRFVKKAQALGFTLAEVKKIMRESNKGLDNCCGYVGKALREKLAELEIKMKEIKKMRSGLEDLLRCWVPLGEAKRQKFAVCPQIEFVGNRKGGGRRNGKEKN